MSGPSDAFGAYQRTRYIRALDGLRAISAALVVTWHTRDEPLRFLQGERGVTVFFVLSGFLITMLALREEERVGQLSVKGFFIRRAFRIFPLYYVVLVGYVVVVYFFDSGKWGDFTQALPYYSLYLSEVPLLFEEIEAPFNHSWSLGIEEKFYLVWPFLAFVVMARKSGRLLMATGLGLALLAGGVLLADSAAYSLLEPYGHILVGAGLAFALHDRVWFERLSFLRDPGVYWLLALACLAIGLTGARWAFELLAPATALFLGAMVTQPNHSISKMLGWRPLVWLGTLSYAVYLIHPAVLAGGERIIKPTDGRLDDIGTLVIGYAGSVAIAAFLHIAVEKPFMALGKRFDSSRRTDRQGVFVGSPGEAADNVEAAAIADRSELISSAVRVAAGSDSDPIVLASVGGELTVPAGWGQWHGIAPLAAAVAANGSTATLDRAPPLWGTSSWETQASLSTVDLETSVLPLVGDPFDEPEPDPQEPVPQASKRSRWWLPVVLFALLLAIAAWLSLSGGNTEESPLSSEAAPARIADVAVLGSRLVGADGEALRLTGVSQSGAEYACVQGWGIFDGDASSASATVISSWGFNAVRLPLNEHCWLGFEGLDPAYSGPSYRRAILDYVDVLRGEGLAVVLALSWSGPGPLPADGSEVLPNERYSLPFWKSLAESVGDRDAVLLELYASPDLDDLACNLNGCERAGIGYVGSQALVDTIRAVGASNPIIVSAPSPGADVTRVAAELPSDPLDQMIVGFRARASVDCSDPSCWDSTIDARGQDVAVIATEVGDRSCSSTFIAGALRAMANNNISFFASTWNAWGPCPGGPSLIVNSEGLPSDYGAVVKSVLAE